MYKIVQNSCPAWRFVRFPLYLAYADLGDR